MSPVSSKFSAPLSWSISFENRTIGRGATCFCLDEILAVRTFLGGGEDYVSRHCLTLKVKLKIANKKLMDGTKRGNTSWYHSFKRALSPLTQKFYFVSNNTSWDTERPIRRPMLLSAELRALFRFFVLHTATKQMRYLCIFSS